MIEIENEQSADRERELFVGHMVTWGAIIAALLSAIILTHFSSAENEETASPPHAEATS